VPERTFKLLRRLRALPCVAKAQTPIAVTFDMHCNFHEQGLLADTIAGYQTYPHEDQYETAVRAGSALLRMMEGACKPTIAWAPRPMLPHVMRQSSLEPYSVPERTFKTPNRAIQARCREMESSGEALCASFFVGFPHADIRMAGVAAVVVTDGNAALAERLRDELLEMAWAARADFVYEPEPLASAIDRARAMAAVPLAEGEARKPVILLDHCDNCASGGTMDTMCVLRAVLAAQLTDVCFFGIFDPAAAQTLIDAGAGARVQLELGGKLPMPAIGEEVGVPLPVAGVVVAAFAEMEAAVLRVGGGGVDGVDICVVSRHVEPTNLEVIRRLGIEPTKKRFLVLKSRVHWQNSLGFGPIYRGVVECDGVGVCGSDYSVLTFENVRRPIFPLDNM
jgi:microcystin degradation protein MlrC